MNKLIPFLLFLILIGGFVARLYKIDNPVADWHSWRQGDTASVTRIYLERGVDFLHPRYQDLSALQTGFYNPEGWRFVELPIYNFIHYYFIKFNPSHTLEYNGRLVSIFSSLVSIVLMYLIGKRFLGRSGGLLSAFLFAFLPFNIYFSRVILPEPLSVAFALTFLYVFIKWFDTSHTKYLYLAAVFFALALLVKPYTVFYGVPALYLALVKFDWNIKRLLKDYRFWIFGLISLVPVFTWRYWMLFYPEGIPFYKWAFNQEGIRFKPAFWRWIFGDRLGYRILGIWLLPAFALGLLEKFNRRDNLFLHVFGLGMFLYVSVIAAANVRHDYYQTLIIPAVVLISAKGLIYLWETKDLAQPSAKVLAVFSLGLGLMVSWFIVRDYYQINHFEIITAGEAVDKIAPSGALVVAPLNGDTAFLYQTKRSGWPIQNEPVEDLVKKGADYYVSVNLDDPQTQDAMRKFEIPVQTDQYVIIDLNKKRMPK